MSLSSSSTLAEIQAAYDDNSSYDLNGSVSQCKNFIIACRMLLRRTPTAATQDRGSIQMNTDALKTALDLATQWLFQNSGTTNSDGAQTGGGTRHFDLSNFRDERGYR